MNTPESTQSKDVGQDPVKNNALLAEYQKMEEQVKHLCPYEVDRLSKEWDEKHRSRADRSELLCSVKYGTPIIGWPENWYEPICKETEEQIIWQVYGDIT